MTLRTAGPIISVRLCLCHPLVIADVAVLLFRRIHVLLLVLGLLTCPGRCMAGSDTPLESAKPARTCHCCQNHDDCNVPRQNQPSPARPIEDDCIDCLCQGAVISGESKVALDAPLSPNPLSMRETSATIRFAEAAEPTARPGPLLAMKTGSHLRLFIESLLL